jgi:hypothetical protein
MKFKYLNFKLFDHIYELPETKKKRYYETLEKESLINKSNNSRLETTEIDLVLAKYDAFNSIAHAKCWPNY